MLLCFFLYIGLIVASAAKVYYYLHQSIHISSVLQTYPGVRANGKFKTPGDVDSSDLEGLCVIYQHVCYLISQVLGAPFT